MALTPAPSFFVVRIFYIHFCGVSQMDVNKIVRELANLVLRDSLLKGIGFNIPFESGD